MLLNVNGIVAKDQNIVVKEFAGYFSTLANNIGDNTAKNLEASRKGTCTLTNKNL